MHRFLDIRLRKCRNRKGLIATECSYRELGDRKSPSVVQGQSGGGLGDEVPQKLKGVRWGCPLPTGESGSGLGGGCAPFPYFLNFYLKMVSFGAFWVALYVTYLLIY